MDIEGGEIIMDHYNRDYNEITRLATEKRNIAVTQQLVALGGLTVPPHILMSKRLTAGEKLLYSIILAFCAPENEINQDGCSLTNQQLSVLMGGGTVRAIQYVLDSLQKKGAIRKIMIKHPPIAGGHTDRILLPEGGERGGE